MRKVIIIEDHPIVVFNLKIGLQQYDDIHIVDNFSTGKSLLEFTGLKDIDVALLDINLPDTSGFEICPYLKKVNPHIKIIGYSSFEDYEYINRFMKAGADGYIVKGAKIPTIYEAITKVMNGEFFFCEISSEKLENIHKDNSIPTVKLTKRETQLIELLKANNSLDQISKAIGEDLKTTILIIDMLKEKINFYQLPVLLPEY